MSDVEWISIHRSRGGKIRAGIWIAVTDATPKIASNAATTEILSVSA
ncbi:MAG: hypothetical protein ABL984_12125 [Pyrinomonadaceae bacterium]